MLPRPRKDQLERTLRYIAMGIEGGARLVTGGERPVNSELAYGNFVQPTVFADVTPQMRIAREECLEELLAFTREKNIHIRRNQRSARPMART